MATYGVLGPLRVVDDKGHEIVVTGQRQRRLLSALLLHRGHVVSADRLGELVWGDGAPLDSAALQSLVFRLRQRIPELDLEYRAPGYVLWVADDAVDAARFERAVLDATARRLGDPAGARRTLEEALALWRGEPFDDLVDADDGRIEIDRLLELRCRAHEERFELALDLGGAAEVVADLEAFAIREPLREHPRHLLIRAYESLGRRADALRVYDAYRRRLADELGVAPSPDLQRRHDALLGADTVERGPERGSDAPATTARSLRALRKPTSSFIGRDDLVAATIAGIGEARLLTLVGPGGVGKTRLATEIAHRINGRHVDGVLWCDLSAATDRTVIDVVIAAAAVESRADQPDLERLVDVLRLERCCVVLDNCEHVIDAAAAIAERLVESTEHVVVLATSRERLAVDGERVVTVPPLPHGVGPASPATLLVVDRMTAITGRAPSDDELEQLGQLASRLDGLPLALELAAARLQTLTPREVLDGLEESVTILRGGRRTVDRHRSVDAALRWSYELLDDSTRGALRAAAVFSAPFRPADVAAVLDIDHASATEALSTLIERSMAHRDGERIYLLHVVRRFAEDQTEADERDRYAARLSSRMRDVAAALRSDLRTAVGSNAIDEYIVRVADFRRAIEFGLARGDSDTPLRIVASLRDLALNSSSFDLVQWSEAAAVAGERDGHELTVDGYAIAGIAAWKRGALDETRRLLVLAEGLAERLGLEPTYELLGTQATEHLAHGALDQAIARLQQAAELPDALDDPIRRAETDGTLVICMAYAHRADAIDVADALAVELADEPAAIVGAWSNYASGECRLDADPELARQHLQRAMALGRAGGSTFLEGIAGASLASLDVRSNDHTAAIANYRGLLPLWIRAGLQSPFWTGMRAVVDLLTRCDETTAAIRLLGAVMAPDSGHDVFGDDAVRLEALHDQLAERVEATAFDREFAAGAGFDEAAAAQEATAAFDRVTAAQ